MTSINAPHLFSALFYIFYRATHYAQALYNAMVILFLPSSIHFSVIHNNSVAKLTAYKSVSDTDNGSLIISLLTFGIVYRVFQKKK